MLKWKRVSSGVLTLNEETLVDFLGGIKGKVRKIVKASFTPTANKQFRLYRDAEQIVDFDSYTLNGQAPFIDMDLSVKEGQQVKAGFYNASGATTAIEMMLAYEEPE